MTEQLPQNGRIAQLKVEHSVLFENLVTAWARKARIVSQGKVDRTWAYSCAEQEFAHLMREKGIL